MAGKRNVIAFLTFGIRGVRIREKRIQRFDGLAERVFILDKGMIVYEGILKKVISNEDLKNKYLAV